MKRVLIVGAALFALAGCSTGEVKLGVDVAPLKIASDAVTTETGVSDLQITRVRLLVAHAKIGYAGGGCRSGGEDGTDTGPYVVDLTQEEIENGAHREFDLGELPSGTYGGAEIEIEPIDDGQDASDEVFADFQKSGASLLVEGVYGRSPFSFAGRWLAEQGTDGEVEVDAAKPVSLAMMVDTSSWFKDANDAIIDPTDVTQHDTLSVAICKSLDTQPQLEKPADGRPRKGPGGPGGGGGGGEAHCVEGTP